MSEKSKIPVKTISFVMVITLFGKVLGLLRDRLLTINYGSGMEANAFLTASRIPRVFFDAIFASAIAASFIPVFNEYFTKKGRKEALDFSGNFTTVMAFLTFALTALGMIFAKPLVSLFADGYNAETASLCVTLTRIMFPTVLFTGIAYSFVGILQSFDEFNIPALISVISNAIIIIYYFTLNDRFGVYGLAVAFLIGWLMQAVVQIPSLKKRGFYYKPSLSFGSEGMKKVFTLMLPVMVSTWVQPINLTINSKFGSRLWDGAGVSAIELSNNLYTIIIGVFVLSVTNVIFPRLAKLNAGDDRESFNDTVKSTARTSLFFVIPMTAGLMLLSKPLVSLIYGGGEFDAFSVSITSKALIFMSLGMVGYALQAILCRVYFAEQNGKVPLFAGLASIVVNIALCVLLIGRFDVAGLAVASAVASTVNALLLLIPLQRKNCRIVDKKFVTDMLKIVVASLVMLAVAYGAILLLTKILPGVGAVNKFAAVAIPALCGVLTYFAATLALRLDESVLAANMIKKKLVKKS